MHADARFKDFLPKKEYFSKALYTIDIGQNDLGMGFFTNMSIEAVNASVPDMINRLSDHIKVILDKIDSLMKNSCIFFSKYINIVKIDHISYVNKTY